ncbi:MFS transporter [Streptomyces albospinus]|uniref:MFS transporter n=1 Tax=Streptomyces albospinus TaxID=285515 RepID=UPI001E520A73|nr:MFS transporter [Streptomyces albospinus]
MIGLAYEGRDHARAFAVRGAVAGAAAGIGNVAGGMLTQLPSWQWIFYGALPLCAVALRPATDVPADHPVRRCRSTGRESPPSPSPRPGSPSASCAAARPGGATPRPCSGSGRVRRCCSRSPSSSGRRHIR